MIFRSREETTVEKLQDIRDLRYHQFFPKEKASAEEYRQHIAAFNIAMLTSHQLSPKAFKEDFEKYFEESSGSESFVEAAEAINEDFDRISLAKMNIHILETAFEKAVSEGKNYSENFSKAAREMQKIYEFDAIFHP